MTKQYHPGNMWPGSVIRTTCGQAVSSWQHVAKHFIKQNHDQAWTRAKKVNVSILFSCTWFGVYNVQNQILKEVIENLQKRHFNHLQWEFFIQLMLKVRHSCLFLMALVWILTQAIAFIQPDIQRSSSSRLYFPNHRQDVIQGQFLSGVHLIWYFLLPDQLPYQG